ncbi:hypothetical protein QN391_25810, partial [Pseudomonas sp. CCI1.2]|uniref:hypothetical protein n=1 Tax=Pseudomonas sp. CCI1.2 TaxID=3048614 RepID=UPI002B23C70F
QRQMCIRDSPGVQMVIAGNQPGVSAKDLTDERQLDTLSGNAALNGVPVQVLSLIHIFVWRGVVVKKIGGGGGGG